MRWIDQEEQTHSYDPRLEEAVFRRVGLGQLVACDRRRDSVLQDFPSQIVCHLIVSNTHLQAYRTRLQRRDHSESASWVEVKQGVAKPIAALPLLRFLFT